MKKLGEEREGTRRNGGGNSEEKGRKPVEVGEGEEARELRDKGKELRLQ